MTKASPRPKAGFFGWRRMLETQGGKAALLSVKERTLGCRCVDDRQGEKGKEDPEKGTWREGKEENRMAEITTFWEGRRTEGSTEKGATPCRNGGRVLSTSVSNRPRGRPC